MSRYVDEQAIDDIALGASVLGSGGGGDPYLGALIAKQAMNYWGPVHLWNINDIEDNALFIPCSSMGLFHHVYLID